MATIWYSMVLLTATFCTLAPAEPVPYCCPPMYMDCDKNATTGCETNVASDPLNCGYCGISCYVSVRKDAALPRSSHMYTDVVLQYMCEEGRGNGHGDHFRNGCETDLRGVDPENCGDCGMRCPENSGPGAGDIIDIAQVNLTAFAAGSGKLRCIRELVGVVSLVGCRSVFA